MRLAGHTPREAGWPPHEAGWLAARPMRLAGHASREVCWPPHEAGWLAARPMRLAGRPLLWQYTWGHVNQALLTPSRDRLKHPLHSLSAFFTLHKAGRARPPHANYTYTTVIYIHICTLRQHTRHVTYLYTYKIRIEKLIPLVTHACWVEAHAQSSHIIAPPGESPHDVGSIVSRNTDTLVWTYKTKRNNVNIGLCLVRAASM